MELNTKHIKSSLSGCPLYILSLSLYSLHKLSSVLFYRYLLYYSHPPGLAELASGQLRPKSCFWLLSSVLPSHMYKTEIFYYNRGWLLNSSPLCPLPSEWSEDINKQSRLCPNQLISSLITWWPETCSIDLCAVLLNHSITSLSLCSIFDWRTQNRSQLLVIQFVVDIHLQTQRWSRQKHLNTFLKALESIFSSLLNRDLIKSPDHKLIIN